LGFRFRRGWVIKTVVVIVVIGSKRGVFLFRLKFFMFGFWLLWRRRWEQETKVVFVVVFYFRFWRRGRRWKDL
jgi:hypothetical protein